MANRAVGKPTKGGSLSSHAKPMKNHSYVDELLNDDDDDNDDDVDDDGRK